MKILLHSVCFEPSVGGLETVSKCLAEHYVALGHHCTVVTRTPEAPSGLSQQYSFEIFRNPTLRQRIELVRSHDLLHANGISVGLLGWAKLFGKPVVWTHQGFQLQAIDGSGWVDGQSAPLTPLASVRFHWKNFGATSACVGGLKLFVRRLAARLVNWHVSITRWVAKRQPAQPSSIIYNPFPLSRFREVKKLSVPIDYDFFYVGRLVSEKGVATLIRAFSLFLERNPQYARNLLIVGDGSWREILVALAQQLKIEQRIDFVGRQVGDELLSFVARGSIAIVPSESEEPMGGVALEMLAAGKAVIVAEFGGLAECVGTAGLTFPNGEAGALCQQMQRLYEDPTLVQELRSRSDEQLAQFDERQLCQSYLELFNSLR